MTETEWDATYGESDWNIDESEIDAALAARTLWTHVEGDYCTDYLLAGYHPVNAIQFVRATNPWPHVDVPPVGPLRGDL